MTVTSIEKDLAARTLTVTAQFAADPARVWQVWADPRRLERWWGPPTHPATFVEHALEVGHISRYFMTGPDGERYHGWWRIVAVAEPTDLAFEDGFADDEGRPNDELPVTQARVRLHDDAGGTRMVIESTFPSTDAMAQVLAMGMEEGLTQALGQIDALLVA